MQAATLFGMHADGGTVVQPVTPVAHTYQLWIIGKRTIGIIFTYPTQAHTPGCKAIRKELVGAVQIQIHHALFTIHIGDDHLRTFAAGKNRRCVKRKLSGLNFLRGGSDSSDVQINRGWERNTIGQDILR